MWDHRLHTSGIVQTDARGSEVEEVFAEEALSEKMVTRICSGSEWIVVSGGASELDSGSASEGETKGISDCEHKIPCTEEPA